MTSHLPEPDLVIRTSGEKRLSNFLLWQIAYSELYFTKTQWPDFNVNRYMIALKNFVNRKIVIAKDLLEPFKKDTSIENIKVLKEFLGKDLKGTICSHPFSKIGYD